jgi:hypothetical protein
MIVSRSWSIDEEELRFSFEGGTSVCIPTSVVLDTILQELPDLAHQSEAGERCECCAGSGIVCVRKT